MPLRPERSTVSFTSRSIPSLLASAWNGKDRMAIDADTLQMLEASTEVPELDRMSFAGVREHRSRLSA